jgi:hypothetical protein
VRRSLLRRRPPEDIDAPPEHQDRRGARLRAAHRRLRRGRRGRCRPGSDNPGRGGAAGETRRKTKVIGRLPGERSCLSLVWAVLDRASRGWRGVVMTRPLSGGCKSYAASSTIHHDSRRWSRRPSRLPPNMPCSGAHARGFPPEAGRHPSCQQVVSNERRAPPRVAPTAPRPAPSLSRADVVPSRAAEGFVKEVRMAWHARGQKAGRLGQGAVVGSAGQRAAVRGSAGWRRLVRSWVGRARRGCRPWPVGRAAAAGSW